jgi:hypothetical protein
MGRPAGRSDDRAACASRDRGLRAHEVRFARASPLEGTRFEPSVPRRARCFKDRLMSPLPDFPRRESQRDPDTEARPGRRHLPRYRRERLRRGEYYCRRLGVHLSWVGGFGGWWDETDFHETRDTGFLLARLKELWTRVPRYKPLSVGVVLLDLVPAAQHQPDLFDTDTGRRQKLSPLIGSLHLPRHQKSRRARGSIRRRSQGAA